MAAAIGGRRFRKFGVSRWLPQRGLENTVTLVVAAICILELLSLRFQWPGDTVR